MSSPDHFDPTLEARGISFREVQTFRQWWLWLLTGIAPATVISLFGYGFHRQLVRGVPWEDQPFSDTALLWFGSAMMIFSLIPVVLFRITRLITEVRRDHLAVRLAPFPGMQIPYPDIARCYPRTYRPIREYGGWCIRFSLSGHGKAYNVSNNRGVQLELKNGRHILIGSQRTGELYGALENRVGTA